MKFNALVVAAMVITSVNAAGEGGLLSCLGRICGSRSRVTQNSQVNEQDQLDGDSESAFSSKSRHEPIFSQNFDTTKKDGDNGSNELDPIEQACRIAASSLKHSHDQVLKFFGGAKSQQSVSSGLNDGTKNSKAKGAYHSTSHHHPTFGLEKMVIQRQRLLWEASYDMARKEFVEYDCLTKYPGLLSQDDVKRMDMLFY
ncbi:hypothetical protein BASA50_006317 [Batrachochytrium salamandrivorans]|uniref:Uncharacterized protein n=1 Tax=Batrachochytrium salamandrivorans TaxID=1357716 RepID=A0ABQ8FAD5_9FUNG|nr:hypothetical protein BASA50_006317 [Batrachochytrium salamandrivorans]KAH9276795.1 hypothetical protein BASA83_000930 [Batrachochytrium salamandrivorans]